MTGPLHWKEVVAAGKFVKKGNNLFPFSRIAGVQETPAFIPVLQLPVNTVTFTITPRSSMSDPGLIP